jgi:hypothetical protein
MQQREYEEIIVVLIENNLIGGIQGGYYGIFDNKHIRWALDYPRNDDLKLPKIGYSLDGILTGVNDNFADLKIHLLKLYEEYKNTNSEKKIVGKLKCDYVEDHLYGNDQGRCKNDAWTFNKCRKCFRLYYFI